MHMFFFALSELIYSSLNCYYFQHWFGLLAVWLLVWFSPTSYSWVWWCMNFRICYSSIFLSLYDENDWKRAKEAQIIFLCLLFDYSWVWWFGSTQAPLRPTTWLAQFVSFLLIFIIIRCYANTRVLWIPYHLDVDVLVQLQTKIVLQKWRQ